MAVIGDGWRELEDASVRLDDPRPVIKEVENVARNCLRKQGKDVWDRSLKYPGIPPKTK